MAFKDFIRFGFSNDQAIDAITQGSAWDTSATTVVHWGISNGFSGEYWTSPKEVVSNMSGLLKKISTIANIQFTYVGHFEDPEAAYLAGADINYSLDAAGMFFRGTDVWALGFPPDFGHGVNGDIILNLNSAANMLPSYSPGSQGYFLFLHETLHALGLKHTHDDGGTGRPTLSDLGLPGLDVDVFSVMSYNDDLASNESLYDPVAPMLLDAIGLMFLYGLNLNNNTGDDTYWLADDGIYDLIWDPRGEDTVSFLRASKGWHIELPKFEVSEIVNVKTGFAIIQSEYASSRFEAPTNLKWLVGDIENAQGSNHLDVLVGNEMNNRLLGRGGDDLLFGEEGDDFLHGGGGFDTAGYRQASTESAIEIHKLWDGTALRMLSEVDGSIDTLRSIEKILFPDTEVYVEDLYGAGMLSSQQYLSLAELYVAIFNRAADAEGLLFWADKMSEGLSLADMSSLFFQQAETYDLYADAVSDADFAERVYHNVLGRDPDMPGKNFWVGQLEAGAVSRDQFVLHIIEGAKAGGTTSDVEFLATKAKLGLLYGAYHGFSDVQAAHEILQMYGSQNERDLTSALTRVEEEVAGNQDEQMTIKVVGILDALMEGFVA